MLNTLLGVFFLGFESCYEIINMLNPKRYYIIGFVLFLTISLSASSFISLLSAIGHISQTKLGEIADQIRPIC